MSNHKKNARVALKYAVDHGKLERLACEVCGNPKSEGHHNDYNKPLQVKWLCKRHHSELHFGNPEPLVPVSFRCEGIKEEIRIMAKNQHRTMSSVIRELLESALQARQSTEKVA